MTDETETRTPRPRSGPDPARVAGLLLLGSLGGGCGADSEEAPRLPPAVATHEVDSDEERANQLRALGYTAYGDELVEPDGVVVPVLDAQRCSPGYTLICSGALALAELVDLEGNVVHSWQGGEGVKWSNAELLENGDLVVPAQLTGEWQGLVRQSWEGEELWRGDARAHHDVEPLPRGRFATLTNLGGRRVPGISETTDIKDHGIAILSDEGDVLDEVSIFDLMSTAPDVFHFQIVGRQTERRPIIDLLHCNSIEFMRQPKLAKRSPLYALGNVLISIRHQDTVAILDWNRRKLLWAFGQGVLEGQHDAQVLPNGHILIFDNGLERSWSRVVEVDPLTDEIVWEYRSQPEDFFTLRKGSAQRLPNGNLLIANSDSGEVFEVTPDGERVWCYLNPHANEEGYRATIVRAKRYPAGRIDELLTR